ncbi:MAG: Mrp/NBP35 family ATP-binding protein [Rikenellaceae bacterium]|nr:Mrp/NBP35 family ATP-binding protein [Rikenellaceae bacterium]
MTQKQIEDVLRSVVHPVKEADIITLGMVEDIKIEEGKIRFKLVFPSPDALSGSIKQSCEEAIKRAFPSENLKVSILELVRERKIAKKVHLELGQEALANVGHIIAVASGKGGVGKSTVAVNLAIALAREGFRVGLADADVYGPSVPKMTATEGAQPVIDDAGGKEMIVPIEKYGVKWMSIGYFAEAGQPLIWRGPMASNALKQMVLQVKWGELDFLLIDLPPGTGDIHISIVHDIPLSGAIVVSTPQAVALADVEKGVNMFRNKDINKPVLGFVENMAWFTPEELPENKYYIFGKDGCNAMSEKFDIPVLAQIPIVQSIRESGDNGSPVALTDRADSIAFRKLARKIIDMHA